MAYTNEELAWLASQDEGSTTSQYDPGNWIDPRVSKINEYFQKVTEISNEHGGNIPISVLNQKHKRESAYREMLSPSFSRGWVLEESARPIERATLRDTENQIARYYGMQILNPNPHTIIGGNTID